MWKCACFIAPPSSNQALRRSTVNAAILAGAIASPSIPALAVDQTYDSFGPPELAAFFIPWLVFGLAYLEWEQMQEPVDDVFGTGTLKTPIDIGTDGKQKWFARGDNGGPNGEYDGK